MPRGKSLDGRKRYNIMMPSSVRATAGSLVRTLHKSSFSQLLIDLVTDEERRQASGDYQNLSALLTENRELKEKLQNCKADFRSLQRRGETRICEAKLRKHMKLTERLNLELVDRLVSDGATKSQILGHLAAIQEEVEGYEKKIEH
jgi:hypothetical protein